MSLIFADTEDLFKVSDLFLTKFKNAVVLNDERGILIKILSYKNGFSGKSQLSGEYVDLKIIFEVYNISDRSS